GVLLIPTRLVVGADTPRPQPLAAVFAASGAEGVGDALRRTFHIGFDSVVSVDDTRWAALVSSVAPVVVDNTDELVRTDATGTEEVAFPVGVLELEPESVGEFL